MTPVSLAGTASYMPTQVIDNAFFDIDDTHNGATRGGMFRGPRERRHLGAGELATDMIERAARTLCDRVGVDPSTDIDLLLTNVSLPDSPFTGCGASVSHRLGCRPMRIVDLHNTGCVSFVFMMDLARSLMTTTGARTALLCNAQTAAGRVFSHPHNRVRPQSAIPGDGCGVGLLVAGDESPVLSIATRSCGEFADDMLATSDCGGAYWAPRAGALHLDFTESRIASIVARGNRLVPELIAEACADAGVAISDLDVLVTNQPNQVFLRNWREALQLAPEAHVDTYLEHGNLFGAAIPVSLERAEQTGRLVPGSLVALGGFSHAGDYAAASVIRWRPGSCN